LPAASHSANISPIDMLQEKTIGVVIPCFNEGTQIGKVLETMPELVDTLIVVDDESTDETVSVVRAFIDAHSDRNVVLIEHEKNQGVGAAICTGYREAVKLGIDVTAVMAGDGQMDPKQLRQILTPVVEDRADYAKANRLYFHRAWKMMPHTRYLGNAALSMLTKIASGYWHVADSQTGYTAISLEALETIDLDSVYPRYGCPNDFLVKLNVYDLRVVDVPLPPTYFVGEQSKMRVPIVIPRMSLLLMRLFFWRMWRKYVVHDFHPLVLFFASGMASGLISIVLFIRMIAMWWRDGWLPPINTITWVMCVIASIQFCLFAMFFDMERNRPPERLRRGGRRRAHRTDDDASDDE